MGIPLFDFAATIGKKVFNKDDDSSKASEKLKQHIDKNNPGVDGLAVTVKDGVASITGTAKDQAAFEKAVLMAGNAEGVKSVDASGLQKPVGQESSFVIVAEGDTLWGIAERVYGSGARHEEIFQANREVIENPDLIFPGQKLRIPA